MLTKYEFFYVTHFIQNIITFEHIIEKEYPNIWGCFAKLRAHKNLWFAPKCEKSMGCGLDDKGTAVRFPRGSTL